MNKKTAVITGANRGIGKEIAKQLAEAGFQVIMTGRDLGKVRKAAEEVKNEAVPFSLDVNSEESIKLFANFMKENYAALDVLVNNAAIIGNTPMQEFNVNQIREVMETNLYGPILLTKYLMPLLRKSRDGRVINLSSGMGALDSLKGGGYAAYRLSKSALNAFTLLLSGEQSDVKVFSMCPGWVKTEMGGPGATRSVEKGAETSAWLATAKEAISGKFYRDKKIIPW